MVMKPSCVPSVTLPTVPVTGVSAASAQGRSHWYCARHGTSRSRPAASSAATRSPGWSASTGLIDPSASTTGVPASTQLEPGPEPPGPLPPGPEPPGPEPPGPDPPGPDPPGPLPPPLDPPPPEDPPPDDPPPDEPPEDPPEDIPELPPEDMPDDAPELAPDDIPLDAPDELPPPELLMPELLIPDEPVLDGVCELVGVCDEFVVIPLDDIGPLLEGVCVVPDVLLVNAPVV